MKIAILWHHDADGFSASYAAHHALNENHELLFIPVQHDQPIPYKELREFAPVQVYILDFSYKAPDMRELMDEFNVVVIDHHKSAAEELGSFPAIHKVWEADMYELPIFSGVRIIQEQSGCMLAWAFFNPTEEAPELLHYVQDRDLWKFELEHSKEINAYIATLPFDFQEWADFYMPLAYDVGKGIIAFQDRQIESRVKAAEMVDFHTDDGFAFNKGKLGAWTAAGWLVSEGASISPSDCAKYIIPCVNASDNISELGDALCRAYPDAPFSMTYYDRPDGKRSYSLRSRFGFDVSEVAVAFGGGGHAGAAGFTLPSPPKF